MTTNKFVKPLKKAFFAAVIFLAFSGASWEGPSGIAPVGELPERGFYVTSGSFPANTVVDIVNLETGQTIQAIVRSGQSGPGGTALLSRDAADALGIAQRNGSRIRLNPPSEAIAFSRFTDGRSFSGDPDFDSRAFVRENALIRRREIIANDVYPRDSYSQDKPYVKPEVDISQSAVPSIISPPPMAVEPIVIVMPPPGGPVAAQVPEPIPEPQITKQNSALQSSLVRELSPPKVIPSGPDVVMSLPNPQERGVVPGNWVPLSPTSPVVTESMAAVPQSPSAPVQTPFT
ncbi:MAG: hypothetical protein LBG74_06760, partial [Spirochaetaceae bacterium]|nr:hypothetical protein [Spirochaetaceae bacterium]